MLVSPEDEVLVANAAAMQARDDPRRALIASIDGGGQLTKPSARARERGLRGAAFTSRDNQTYAPVPR